MPGSTPRPVGMPIRPTQHACRVAATGTCIHRRQPRNPKENRMSGVSIAGRTALVTGGASGLGRAVAVALARAEVNVVIGDIDGPGAAETLGQVEGFGGFGVVEHFDVTEREHRRDLIT